MSTHRPWLNGSNRRNFLLGLGALAGTQFVSACTSQGSNLEAGDQNSCLGTQVQGEGLRVRAARKGLSYGAATRHSVLSSDAAFAARFGQECGMLVPEWELKWDMLRPSATQFDFAPADWLANFAQTHSQLFRGHTLVWHEALPEWFKPTVTAQNAEQFMLTHIQTVTQHFAGKVHSWDVVNEAVHEQGLLGGRPDGLRDTPWLKFLGPRYIDLAFHAAAKADPKALLVYNDYGLEQDTRQADAKRAAVLKLLTGMRDRQVPIHALGIQAHLQGSAARLNPGKLRQFLDDVARLGLKILITEMDVNDQGLAADCNQRDRQVAERYREYLSVALAQPAVMAVLTWGLSDSHTWLSEYFARADGLPVRALPLDRQGHRKLAWNVLAQCFDQCPPRR
jgi:endo-1,4-beta-xylanase